MKITNKITNKVMKAATDAAAKVAVSNVNSACTFMLHQPKVPALPKIISTHIESMKIMYSPLTNGVSGTSKELI